MNRSLVIEMLKDLQKYICRSCNEMDYKGCERCLGYILINSILQELNGK